MNNWIQAQASNLCEHFNILFSGYVYVSIKSIRIFHTEHSSNQSILVSTAPVEYTLKWL